MQQLKQIHNFSIIIIKNRCWKFNNRKKSILNTCTINFLWSNTLSIILLSILVYCCNLLEHHNYPIYRYARNTRDYKSLLNMLLMHGLYVQSQYHIHQLCEQLPLVVPMLLICYFLHSHWLLHVQPRHCTDLHLDKTVCTSSWWLLQFSDFESNNLNVASPECN